MVIKWASLGRNYLRPARVLRRMSSIFHFITHAVGITSDPQGYYDTTPHARGSRRPIVGITSDPQGYYDVIL